VQRQIYVLAKETGLLRCAEEFQIRAHVVAAGEAVLAVVTVEGGLEDDAVALGDSADCGIDYDAGWLMPEDHRIHAGRIAD
jgi:hypothetical protein